jgi:hypothetical protein
MASTLPVSRLGRGGKGGGIFREAMSSRRIRSRSWSSFGVSIISGFPRARPLKCDASFLKPERSCDSAACRPCAGLGTTGLDGAGLAGAGLVGAGLGGSGASGAGASLLGRGGSGRVVSIE